MKAHVQWVDGAAMEGISGSGHRVLMDGPPEAGGRDLGPRPMELLLLGMGGCTQFDVLLILRKARQEVTECVVELSAERSETEPKVFTPHPCPFYRHGSRAERAPRRARYRAERHQVLLGVDHARRDRDRDPRLRSARSRWLSG